MCLTLLRVTDLSDCYLPERGGREREREKERQRPRERRPDISNISPCGRVFTTLQKPMSNHRWGSNKLKMKTKTRFLEAHEVVQYSLCLCCVVCLEFTPEAEQRFCLALLLVFVWLHLSLHFGGTCNNSRRSLRVYS